MTTSHSEILKEDNYFFKRMEVIYQMTCLHIQLEYKLEQTKLKGIDTTEQQYKIDCLKSGIDLIIFLEEENKKLKK